MRFRTVSAADILSGNDKSVLADWRACVEERWAPPPIALAAFNLDFRDVFIHSATGTDGYHVFCGSCRVITPATRLGTS